MELFKMKIILETEKDRKWYHDNYGIIPSFAKIKYPSHWIMRVK